MKANATARSVAERLASRTAATNGSRRWLILSSGGVVVVVNVVAKELRSPDVFCFGKKSLTKFGAKCKNTA